MRTDWVELEGLYWPRLIRMAGEGLRFELVSALGDTWIVPVKRPEVPKAFATEQRARAYHYARMALIETHKRIGHAVDDGKATDAEDRAAADAYGRLAAALQGDRGWVGKEAVDELQHGYRIALCDILLRLLKADGPRGVMIIGVVDD